MKTLLLRRYKGKPPLNVLVDDNDYDKVVAAVWWKQASGYIINKDGMYLHRMIMGNPDEMVVDHINGDKLDNRKENLRICTRRENVINSRVSKNNTTGYHGVSYMRHIGKYRAYIFTNGKQIYLGSYTNIDDAITARKQAEEQYFGEFAPKDGACAYMFSD